MTWLEFIDKHIDDLLFCGLVGLIVVLVFVHEAIKAWRNRP